MYIKFRKDRIEWLISFHSFFDFFLTTFNTEETNFFTFRKKIQTFALINNICVFGKENFSPVICSVHVGRVVNRVGNYSTFDRRGRYFLIRNFLTRLDRITRVVVVLFHWIFKMTFPPDVEFCNVFQDVSACLASECGSGFSWFNLSVFEDFSFISRQKSKKAR